MGNYIQMYLQRGEGTWIQRIFSKHNEQIKNIIYETGEK